MITTVFRSVLAISILGITSMPAAHAGQKLSGYVADIENAAILDDQALASVRGQELIGFNVVWRLGDRRYVHEKHRICGGGTCYTLYQYQLQALVQTPQGAAWTDI